VQALGDDWVFFIWLIVGGAAAVFVLFATSAPVGAVVFPSFFADFFESPQATPATATRQAATMIFLSPDVSIFLPRPFQNRSVTGEEAYQGKLYCVNKDKYHCLAHEEFRGHLLLSVADDSTLALRLGTAVSTARKQRGLTQDALAERLDVSKNFIGLIERGMSFPSIPHLTALAALLGLSLDQVLLDKGTTTERWPTETAGILGGIAPEFRDLAENYLRSLAMLRPAKTPPVRKKTQKSGRAPK
jgi:transcriptional regulator with XRE-family HTH domain